MAENFIQKFIHGLTMRTKQSKLQQQKYDSNLSDYFKLQNLFVSFFNRNLISLQYSQSQQRINLYYDYKYILSKIPETSKQVKLIISYILKPDILENESIIFTSSENSILNDLQREFFEYIEIKKYLKTIIHDFLVYGDQYVKIDYIIIKTDSLTDQDIVDIYTEQVKYKPIYKEKTLETIILRKKKNKILEMKYTDKDNNKMIIKENQVVDLSIHTNGSTKQKQNEYYLPYKLTVLSPFEVIKLQEFNIDGYLVIPKSMVEQYFMLSNLDDSYKALMGTYDDISKITSKFVDHLKNNNVPEDNIMELIIENDSQLKFYPSQSGIIFNFVNLEDNSFFPYGTSILKEQREIQFYIFLLEMQLLVYKINRQTSRRIIQIPIDGVPPEQITEYIETIRQKLKNEITIDFNGDLRSVPQILSILDDYYIPVENGTPVFSIDLLQGDTSQQEQFQNELNYFNKKIIMSLSIPYQYVTVDENRQINTRLLQEDEHFQRTVDEFQQQIETTLNDMLLNFLYKVHKETYYEPIVKLQRPIFFNKLLYYEIQNSKIEYQQKLKDIIPNLPTDYILSEILDFSNQEIDKIKEMIEEQELQNNNSENKEQF